MIVSLIVLNISVTALVLTILLRGKKILLLWISIIGFGYLFIDLQFGLLSNYLIKNINNGDQIFDYLFYVNTLSFLITVFLLFRKWLIVNFPSQFDIATNKSVKKVSEINKNYLSLVGGLIIVAVLLIFVYHNNFKDKSLTYLMPPTINLKENVKQPESSTLTTVNDNGDRVIKSNKSEAVHNPDDDQIKNQDSTNDLGISKIEIEKFVDDYLYRNTRDLIDYVLKIYADQVDFYDEGLVDRNFIIRDKINYFDKWPTRSYELTTLVKVTSQKKQNLWIAEFNYNYHVANYSRKLNGQAWCRLKIIEQDGLKIVDEKGGLMNNSHY